MQIRMLPHDAAATRSDDRWLRRPHSNLRRQHWANSARDQIGHLAIREPTRPSIALASELDSKGRAAGKTAVAAGVGWLSGSFDAAGQSNDEGTILVSTLWPRHHSDSSSWRSDVRRHGRGHQKCHRRRQRGPGAGPRLRARPAAARDGGPGSVSRYL